MSTEPSRGSGGEACAFWEAPFSDTPGRSPILSASCSPSVTDGRRTKPLASPFGAAPDQWHSPSVRHSAFLTIAISSTPGANSVYRALTPCLRRASTMHACASGTVPEPFRKAFESLRASLRSVIAQRRTRLMRSHCVRSGHLDINSLVYGDS